MTFLSEIVFVLVISLEFLQYLFKSIFFVSKCTCQDPELNLAIELSLKEQKRKQSRSSVIDDTEDNLEDNLCFIL